MEKKTAIYSKKGTYAGYDKNHKEREALDYYSTPTEEVVNILKTLNIDFHNQVILEPCCGGGHMYEGISQYCEETNNYPDAIVATDIMERGGDFPHCAGKEYDFITDDYKLPVDSTVDYIIMNPPYKLIEPFVMKALSVAEKGVLMLGRLQFLEGEKRYENILKDFPPTHVFVYVDRIACFINGDTSVKPSSVQAYAWYYWDLNYLNSLNIVPPSTFVHWIRRSDKV